MAEFPDAIDMYREDNEWAESIPKDWIHPADRGELLTLAQEIVSHPAIMLAIEDVANALISKKTLTGDEVKTIYQQAMSGDKQSRAVEASPAEGKSTARSEAARARWAKLKAEGHTSLKDAAKVKKGGKR